MGRLSEGFDFLKNYSKIKRNLIKIKFPELDEKDIKEISKIYWKKNKTAKKSTNLLF